jgi:hypothetical protein
VRSVCLVIVVLVLVLKVRTRRVDQRWIDRRERHCCGCFAQFDCLEDLLNLLYHNRKICTEDVEKVRFHAVGSDLYDEPSLSLTIYSIVRLCFYSITTQSVGTRQRILPT